MSKYRKKPITVDAYQLVNNHGKGSNYPEWLNMAIVDGTVTILRDKDKGMWANIRTLEGIMRADEGDYIIRGIKGEMYPCKSDIFSDTYEKLW